MRIYLDFDGVLHAIPAIQGSFEHLSTFEDVLREYPRIEVVISSSWRLNFSLEDMRGWFSEDVQHQVKDVTPNLPSRRRVDEIRAHIQATGYRQRFIVLDDAASEFPRNYPPLILCRTMFGLGEQELGQLRKMLSASR